MLPQRDQGHAIAAGLLEGAAIGWAQRHVLHRDAPHVDGRAWMLATIAAAGLAWFVGMGGGSVLITRRSKRGRTSKVSSFP